jgi:DNA-binding response OmpR family regulator
METILVLEDDAAIREAIGLILELDGYSVEAAGTPAHAIHLCRVLPSVDLLVSDIGLPQGSGAEVALEARHCRGGLPVLFISGKPVEEWELRDQMYLRHFTVGRVDFLEKPFLPEALREKVRELLRSGPIGK